MVKKRVLAAFTVLLVFCMMLPLGASAQVADEAEQLPPEVQQVVQEIYESFSPESVRITYYENGYISFDLLPNTLFAAGKMFTSVTKYNYPNVDAIPQQYFHTASVNGATYSGMLNLVRFGCNTHTMKWDATFEGYISSINIG